METKVRLSIVIYLLIIFVFNSSYEATLPENEEIEDPDMELSRQIQILDNYVYNQMITKQNQTTETPRPTEVPDMSIFTQLYETAIDGLKSKGICIGCKVGIGFLMYKVRVSKLNETDIQSMTIFACKLFKIATPEVCTGLIERYGPTFTYIFQKRPDLTAEAFCGVMLQSYGCTTNAPQLEWTVDIPPPKTQERMIKIKSKKITPRINFTTHGINNTGRIKIIQLSDLHVDPLYEVGANAECDNNILCCQGSQGRPLSKSLQAGKFGDGRKCDVPYSTLQLTLKHIAEKHSDAELFYMTGDIVPHNVWSTTESDNTKIINTTAKYILQYFPNMTVIPVLGNHEPHPVNFFSPHDVPDELSTTWIYRNTYEMYKQWIPSHQSQLYLTYGYYSVEINHKFKIIVPNTNFCYEFNVWQMYEPVDTGGQLKWLINELEEAESKDQTVHIVSHVPPGHDECFRVFSKNFYNVILRYHHIVKGQFYGHTHYGELKVFYDLQHRPINNLWISPSLTPYEVNNVAYRVYYADPVNYEIMDHETWVFDLKSANKNPGNDPEWISLYSGSGTYGVEDVTPKSMDIFVNKMATDSTAFQKFYKHYYKLLDDDVGVSCSTHCRKRILCGIVRSYAGEEENCNRIQKKVDGIILPISLLISDDVNDDDLGNGH